MPAIKARELARMLADPSIGVAKTYQHLNEALATRKLRPEDFSIRDLAEELIPSGREFVRACGPGKSGGINLLEAGTAVSTAQFSNITGQVVFAKVKDAFEGEEFVFSRLVETIPTRSASGEVIPGIGAIGDEAEVVAEGNSYPLVGMNEDYVSTPAPVKRGMIVPVTKECIHFDRTGLILRRAGEVGQFLGLNKEKRIIDSVIDENSTAHRYRWRGTVIATYGDNSGTHTWDNLAASNALVDWTQVDVAELLLANMLDPNTGEPILVMADTLIVTPQLLHVALRVLNATEIRLAAGGYATSGNLSTTVAPNSVGRVPGYSPAYNVLSSRLLPARMATDTTWYLGNPRRAFAYMEAWPITVSQAPDNSEADFTQDIALRFKASEMGAAATLEPRFMVKNTA